MDEIAADWILQGGERGILAPGFAADLAVLDVDPLTAPLDEVAETSARLTMAGGRLAHGSA